MLDDNKIVESVWLGARLDTKTHKFHWEGKTEPIKNYQNWAILKNNTDYECAEIIPDGNDKGKWINTSCKKKNLVVCQKMQGWSLARLQKEFLNMKQDYELQITKLKKDLKDVNSTTIQNPLFPIGFTYVQLPNEKPPNETWPWMTWNDVSSTYENVFFRVTGGKAAVFGQVQEENAPRIIEVNTLYEGSIANRNQHSYENNTISKGEWSGWVYTGSSSGTSRYTRFYMTGGEVRPRNMAIRIWKRTG